MNYEENDIYLKISYYELEKLNLAARSIKDPHRAKKAHIASLRDEERIKAITIYFSDIEGRLHTIDYNKTHLLNSYDNLTFDGSSVRGFSNQENSDLRLSIDWTSLTYLPYDVFGPGKASFFANILNQDGSVHPCDFRGRLKEYTSKLLQDDSIEFKMAPEIEGFLIDGVEAEQNYSQERGFSLVSAGGYYHSLPLDRLRQFIDKTAEAQLAMGFKNEKDHAEVSPSQFEINFKYTDVMRACDQSQLYKLICRQIASTMGHTATFLPKPISRLNGNGMHINLSIYRNDENILWSATGADHISKVGWDFIQRNLNRASEMCIFINGSINAYRRLDPRYEAPSHIKVSSNDRGAMIRIPAGRSNTARLEFRHVPPDCNPYLTLFCIIKTGMEDVISTTKTASDKRPRVKMLPTSLSSAIRISRPSEYASQVIGEEAKQKYIDWKQKEVSRNPSELGEIVKTSEVLFHQEVTNQYLWSNF